MRIFRNELLERLSRSSPQTLMAFWFPVAAAALTVGFAGSGGIWPLLGWSIGTILLWSLFEYCVHRFGFHAPLRGAWGARLTFIIHGCHHVDPHDPTRNLIPLSVSIPAGSLLYAFDLALFPFATATWIAGVFALCYAAYDLLHWRTHQRRGSTRIERLLRRNHMLHHSRGERFNYGVSSPLWDVLFGTFARSKERRRMRIAGPEAAHPASPAERRG